MLGIFCIILTLFYTISFYHSALHYSLPLTILVNLLLIVNNAKNNSFSHAVKKTFIGEILTSFLWIAWVATNPNVFICVKYTGQACQGSIWDSNHSMSIHNDFVGKDKVGIVG